MIKIKSEIPIINIEIPRGNARRFEVTVTADGKPFDLSTANLKMMAKPSTGGTFDTTANIHVAENALTLELVRIALCSCFPWIKTALPAAQTTSAQAFRRFTTP